MAIGFCAWIARAGINARIAPPLSGPGHDAPIHRVNQQQDAFPIYRSAGLWGCQVIHLNRFFNMKEYSPKEQFITTRFPVQVKALPEVFEPGIDSHAWLYIATRLGLVRTVITVLPEHLFREFIRSAPPGGLFTYKRGTISGYSYDIPRLITTMDTLPVIEEPVIVNVDAGFFSEGEDPARTARTLKEKCGDIRMLVLIDSLDEPLVTDAMRAQLSSFEAAWRAQR